MLRKMVKELLLKGKRIVALGVVGLLLTGIPMTVQAAEIEIGQEIKKAEDIDVSEFEQLEIEGSSCTIANEVDINAPTAFSVGEPEKDIDLAVMASERSAYRFADNPNTQISGQLTEENTNDIYFFNITDSDKFLLARLQANRGDYVALLYVLDSDGNVNSTDIYGTTETLMQFNGLPAGEYAIIILASDSAYGSDYVFSINATNPAANLKEVNFLSNDLSIFMFETTAGDVYGNGSFIYNTATKQGTNLSWERHEMVNWGSGYEQRTHQVFGVRVKAISGPVKYSASKAMSDCAVLIYCDVNTSFAYLYSYYQSGVDPVHDGSTKDTTGRETPRGLDEIDFAGGNEHILVYDLNQGKAIDFYSSLNIYYAGGYESTPTVEYY